MAAASLFLPLLIAGLLAEKQASAQADSGESMKSIMAPKPSFSDAIVEAEPWGVGSPPSGYLHVGPDGTQGKMPRWLPGSKQNSDAAPITVRAAYPHAGWFVAHIGKGYGTSALTISVDGRDVAYQEFAQSQSKTPSEWVQKDNDFIGTFNQDMAVPVSAGEHRITCRSAGPSWIEVPYIRLTGVRGDQFHFKDTPTKRIRMVMTQTYTIPNASVRRWAVGVGALGNHPTQAETKSSLEILGANSAPGRQVRDRNLGETGLVAQVDAADTPSQSSITARATYEAVLLRRELVPGPAAQPPTPLSASERRLYVAPTNWCDFDRPELQQWMRDNHLIPNSDESNMEFGFRALQFIGENFTYKWVPGLPTTACSVKRQGWSHCGGLSSLFIAVMRYNHIPARMAQGRFASSTNGSPDWSTYHATSEFYADGVGWVITDPAAAVGTKSAVGAFGKTDGRLLYLGFDSPHDAEGTYFGLQDMSFRVVEGEADTSKASLVDELKVTELPL